MDRVLELLAYLEDWPPAHLILSAVHRSEEAGHSSRSGSRSEDDELRDLGGLASEIGATGAPSAVPSWLRTMASEAEAIKLKGRRK